MKKTFSFFLLSTVVSLGVLYYTNYSILGDSSVSDVPPINTKSKSNVELVKKNIEVPKECSFLNFNNDGTRFAYISNDMAYVSDFEGKEVLVDENNFVSNIKFQSDDSVIYAICKQNELKIKKYNITSNESTNIAEIAVTNLKTVRNIWCEDDNVIIELSVLNGAQRRTRVYSVKNGNVRRLSISGSIANGGIINNAFVYSNDSNKVYVADKEISCFGTNDFRLLASDGNRKIFLSDAYDVTKIIGFKIDDSLSLTPNTSVTTSDSSYIETMYTDSLYMIYEGKAIDALNGLKYSVENNSSILFVSKDTIVYENNGVLYLEKK